MAVLHWLLLPGMHGDGRLFADLASRLGPHTAIDYPTGLLGYPELLAFLRDRLPADPFIVVAESFSGPLGIQLAASSPPGLLGLALVATFATSPSPLARLPSPLLRSAFSLPLSRWAVRQAMIGPHATDPQVDAVMEALQDTDAATMAHRARMVRELDVLEDLARVRVPVRYLQATGDRLVPPRSFAEMTSALPGITVTRIEGPHLILQARPNACASALREFSDSLP